MLALLVGLLFSDMLKVAVLDTGYNVSNKEIPVCSTGSRDFSGTTMNDTSNHGRHITQVIHDNVKSKKRYCQIIIKYDHMNSVTYYKALEYISKDLTDIKVLNLSIASAVYSDEDKVRDKINLEKEKTLIKKIVNRGVIINVAAGNHGKYIPLGKDCNVFPACSHVDVTVVSYRDVFSRANYGPFVDVYERGYKVRSKEGISTGSSIATAIHTGKTINKLLGEKYGSN